MSQPDKAMPKDLNNEPSLALNRSILRRDKEQGGEKYKYVTNQDLDLFVCLDPKSQFPV